jgi:hypothetical protein
MMELKAELLSLEVGIESLGVHSPPLGALALSRDVQLNVLSPNH